ncbi:prephenate dehydrogenase [Labilibaculum filiforme]|uniref:Prephenate dehydrogenase n=1 Tax=Labilibaculum filiforme TaxID=1940526 RepID=A0A2N3HT37_9BACT|nr:prephenate dehydrogenase [Labilibaculum filiforme]PKQ61207.1 prephenate dehydrogenase [Labilibaculum filiforme]
MILSVIGLGLIGGSIALDLKKRGFVNKVIGVDNNTLNAHAAKKLGLIDEIQDLTTAVQAADLVLLAIPVDACLRVLPKIMDLVHHQIVSDLGSTKEQLIESIANHPKRSQFVPAHPMAGTEFSGPQAAHSGLFDGKCSIICNPEDSDKKAVQLISEMFHCLKMRCVFMDAEVHDRQTAYVSHLSHISAFALSLTVLHKEKADKHIFELASGGFDSTVRLAKSSAEMWTPIFQQNKKNVGKVLQKYIDQLQQFKDLIEKDDLNGINDLIFEANDIRRVLDQKEKNEKETIQQASKIKTGA